MNPITLTVNGRKISDAVTPRTHLADFLRERMNLTGTHLRCEQGVCGACTLLIDGQPARSCITYASLCDGAVVTTIEGLDDDPIAAALRSAFSAEHGLQCGFCTPGMMMTARDIVLRLPAADEARIRLELSGNLCRCTGYAGIVRAISRVLKERRDEKISEVAGEETPLGPVGARARSASVAAAATTPSAAKDQAAPTGGVLGLDGKTPNIEIRQFFAVSRPPQDVWAFFSDIARVVSCLPGASLTRPPEGDDVEGKFAAKLGPITASFNGRARVVRDDARRCGKILGAGRDGLGGSRAAGEAEYLLSETDNGTRVDIAIRAVLTGPLAQFGRSGIVEDLVARITAAFAKNLEAQLSGSPADAELASAPLQAGSLLRQVVAARLKAMFEVLFRKKN